MATQGKELQLQTGPYRTTFIGTEIRRASTPDEWENYGEILKRVDEAKQWAIGDWLCDGKKHYGDGLYGRAAKLLGIGKHELSRFKRIADLFEIGQRCPNLSFAHHYELASLKQVKELEDSKLELSDEPDMEKIQEFLHKAEKDGMSVRELGRAIKIHEAEQEDRIRLANEPEKYRIIYADPPWQYNDKLIDTYGAAEHHYKTMSLGEICSLPVKNRTTEEAVLFLWVTSPNLFMAQEVMSAWGFKYKASFIWDKVKHNYGHYNSVRHELLLIGTKGSCLPDADKLFDSVQAIERTEEHSQKPEEFREIIDTLYPNGRRLELFRRGGTIDGWDIWGTEAEL